MTKAEQTAEYNKGRETSRAGISTNSNFVLSNSTPEALPDDQGKEVLMRKNPEAKPKLIPVDWNNTNPHNYSK